MFDLLRVFDHSFSKLTFVGSWKLISENEALNLYESDDPAKEKWQAFEAIDESAYVEIVSTVPEATDWNVRLFFKPGSKVVNGARKESSYPFLRYKTEDVFREEPLRIT